MRVCDFSRSFVTFRLDLNKKTARTVSQKPPFRVNNSRMQIDCLCRMATGEGEEVEYALSASCKSEQVNVSQDIWHQPNADMCIVASQREFMVIKSWDHTGRKVMLDPPSLGQQPERQPGLNEEVFDSLKIDKHYVEGRPLETTGQIVEAALANRQLVGVSNLQMDNGETIRLEYPLKLINVSQEDGYYQVDTGPVLLPDEPIKTGELSIARLRRAFIGFNQPDWAELIVNAPTEVGEGISVNHYSRVRRLDADNRIVEIIE